MNSSLNSNVETWTPVETSNLNLTSPNLLKTFLALPNATEPDLSLPVFSLMVDQGKLQTVSLGTLLWVHPRDQKGGIYFVYSKF